MSDSKYIYKYISGIKYTRKRDDIRCVSLNAKYRYHIKKKQQIYRYIFVKPIIVRDIHLVFYFMGPILISFFFLIKFDKIS